MPNVLPEKAMELVRYKNMTIDTAAEIAKKPGIEIHVPPDSINGESRIRLAKTPIIMSNRPALNRIARGARSSISSVSSAVRSRSSASIAFSSTTVRAGSARLEMGFAAGTSRVLDIFSDLGSGGSLFVSKPLFSIFRDDTSIGFGDGFTVFCRALGSVDRATTLNGKFRAAEDLPTCTDCSGTG